jgi:hypothetical protein
VPTLEAAFRVGGVHLVAVPIDYSENTRVLVNELRAAGYGVGGIPWTMREFVEEKMVVLRHH